jgi:L-serine/L-threonine ammonia-lyase
MKPLHVHTPVWESPRLSELLGAPVLLKMEALQPAGSFKTRGMGRICQERAAAGARRLVCASGGNAGLATAYAGRRLGLPTTVVVPQSTGEWARAAIRREGAEVIAHGAVWDEAHAFAQTLLGDDAAYIHPFDDPLAWAGNSTLVDELAAEGPRPGAVVLSVGGGGLLCGVVEGMLRVGWGDVPVLAVETEGAASYAAALAAGAPVTIDAIRTIAVTLGARRVAARAVELAGLHPIHSRLVSDRAALGACLRFADDHRVLVEPACGAALAAVEQRPDAIVGRGPVVVIVCGGAGVSLNLLRSWDTSLG